MYRFSTGADVGRHQCRSCSAWVRRLVPGCRSSGAPPRGRRAAWRMGCRVTSIPAHTLLPSSCGPPTRFSTSMRPGDRRVGCPFRPMRRPLRPSPCPFGARRARFVPVVVPATCKTGVGVKTVALENASPFVLALQNHCSHRKDSAHVSRFVDRTLPLAGCIGLPSVCSCRCRSDHL